MIQLSRKIEYALIALKHIYDKEPGEVTTAKEISEAHGSPFDMTSRVLQKMVAMKILKSEQGIYGGYILMSDLSKISFLKLLTDLQGKTGITRCADNLDDGCKIRPTCNIVGPLQYLNRRFKELFEDISIKEILKQQNLSKNVKNFVTKETSQNWKDSLNTLESADL